MGPRPPARLFFARTKRRANFAALTQRVLTSEGRRKRIHANPTRLLLVFVPDEEQPRSHVVSPTGWKTV